MNKKLPLLLLFTAIAATGFAQSDSVINRNIRALQSYADAKPIEKVHLHLDRQLYFPGDTIWFKAYVVLGAEHKLSALSGILYAELISPKDTVIKRLNLELNAGTAPGDFELPFNIAPGTYRIRAYTSWMRNFGQEYFFDQLITVSGFSTALAPVQGTAGKLSGSPVPGKVDLQFFPEGGDLVNGLRSKVAFKAINQNGVAEEVQGSIVDNAGNEVATFASQHLGMGAFPLQPQKGKNYIAKVTAADGSMFNVPLPAAKDAGFTLSVNNNLGDSLYVKVAAINVADSAFYLMAQSGGKHYFAAAHKLANTAFTASIPKSRFPTGIVQFTLFSQSGEPLNERVIFIQNDDQLKLQLIADQQSYAPGEKVKLSLQANNPDGTQATGSFSVSVIDESKIPVNEQAENTIFTDLLLKSEISGYIQEPNYYFIKPDDKTRADLDLLMLTQGYRRFEWKKILSGDVSKSAFQPEHGFTIFGTVTTPAGKPAAKGEVILTSVKNHLLMDTLTDDNGRFSFENIALTDTATIIINSKKANGGGNVKTIVDKPDYPSANGYLPLVALGTHSGQAISLSAEQVQLAYKAWKQDSLKHIIQLKEVIIKDRKVDPFHPDYTKLVKYSANLNGPGNANQVIIADDSFLSYSSLAAALTGKIHGAVIGSGGAVSYRALNRHLTGPVKHMAIYVDGVMVEDNELENISPSQVYSVEVLTSAMYYAIYGSSATGGALIVTLKNGMELSEPIKAVPGLTFVKYAGYYKSKEHYQAAYNVNESYSRKGNKAVYWATFETGKKESSVIFGYDHDNLEKTYYIIVEGISVDGKLGSYLLRI